MGVMDWACGCEPAECEIDAGHAGNAKLMTPHGDGSKSPLSKRRWRALRPGGRAGGARARRSAGGARTNRSGAPGGVAGGWRARRACRRSPSPLRRAPARASAAPLARGDARSESARPHRWGVWPMQRIGLSGRRSSIPSAWSDWRRLQSKASFGGEQEPMGRYPLATATPGFMAVAPLPSTPKVRRCVLGPGDFAPRSAPWLRFGRMSAPHARRLRRTRILKSRTRRRGRPQNRSDNLLLQKCSCRWHRFPSESESCVPFRPGLPSDPLSELRSGHLSTS